MRAGKQQGAAPIGLIWRLRRVSAGLRQVDVATHVGISTTRLSAIERGEEIPTDLDARLIEEYLPPLPTGTVAQSKEDHAKATA